MCRGAEQGDKNEGFSPTLIDFRSQLTVQNVLLMVSNTELTQPATLSQFSNITIGLL